jgi:hypothetical protein
MIKRTGTCLRVLADGHVCVKPNNTIICEDLSAKKGCPCPEDTAAGRGKEECVALQHRPRRKASESIGVTFYSLKSRHLTFETLPFGSWELADRPYVDVCESCPCSAWQTLHHGNVCVEIIQSPSYLPPTRNAQKTPTQHPQTPLSHRPASTYSHASTQLRLTSSPAAPTLGVLSQSLTLLPREHTSRSVMVYCCDAYAITRTPHSPRSVGPCVDARSEMLAVAEVPFISAPATEQPKRQHPLIPVSLHALATPSSAPHIR